VFRTISLVPRKESGYFLTTAARAASSIQVIARSSQEKPSLTFQFDPKSKRFTFILIHFT
jgi:hypothetical protein